MLSWDYISAFIDGEGYVANPEVNLIKARIDINNSELYVLEKIKAKLTSIGIDSKITEKKIHNEKYKKQWTLKIYNERNLWLLSNYLNLQIHYKRDALSHWANKYFQREKEKLLALNSKFDCATLGRYTGHSRQCIWKWRNKYG